MLKLIRNYQRLQRDDIRNGGETLTYSLPPSQAPVQRDTLSLSTHGLTILVTFFRRSLSAHASHSGNRERKMADMDGTGQINGLEDDPAAAFLAREQDELADIAGDTLGFGTGDAVVS